MSGVLRKEAARFGETLKPMTKKERIRDFGEVFTPEHIVRDMCDMLERRNPDIFKPETTFLEPACGEGVFVCEILRRKLERCRTREDFRTAIRSVWSMEIQPDNVEKTIQNVTALCEEFFCLAKDDMETIQNHVVLADSLKVLKMIEEMEGRQCT